MTGKTLEKLSEELIFALDVCEKAAEVAMKHFSPSIETITKSDGSPVTIADQECERLIRKAIAQAYPGDAILGEEEGESKGSADSGASNRRWIIDPIDGTYGYARGTAVWSTLLALEEDGEIILGVVSAPAASATYWAERGRGAYKNGARINVSKHNDIRKAQFEFGGLNRIKAEGFWQGFGELVEITAQQRGSGDYLGFAQVFEGKAEAHIEVGVKPWDLAPMKIIVEEAGGRFSDLSGGSSIESGSCLVSNGLLHDEFLTRLTAK